MREVAIVLRRELRSYFASPIAYVFGGLFLLVICYLSVQQILVQGQPASMQAFFIYMPLVFLFFLPALTMRLWAEERKLGTLELLMTFPVTVPQLIAGKFLAALLYLALLLLLTIGIPITLSLYADLDWGPVVTAYVASLLLAASYIAVGMFFSSLTRDQIIALLVALVVLLGAVLVAWPPVQQWLATVLPETVVDGLTGLSPYTYFTSISRGVFDSRDFVFYVCFCAFFLHMNALVLQGRRMKG